MNRAFGPQQTARTGKIHRGAQRKARTVSARRIDLRGGLTALGDCRESAPGALRQAAMDRAFGPQQTARIGKIHPGARTKARTVSALRIDLWGGLTALGDCRESAPGALRQAGMNRAFGSQQTARTGRSIPVHKGKRRRCGPYQPGAKPQVCAHRENQGLKARSIEF